MADPSIIRQKIHQTLDKRFYLERKILRITSPLAEASLVRYRIRCGKKGCSCQKGLGHGPYSYLSAKVKGKTRLKLIPVKRLTIALKQALSSRRKLLLRA